MTVQVAGAVGLGDRKREAGCANGMPAVVIVLAGAAVYSTTVIT
jgi:hypothetical protein